MGLSGLRADMIAALLGVISAMALPPYGLAPVLLLTMPALLGMIDAAPRARIAARRGFVFGLAHHCLGIWWITEAVLVRAAEFWWAVPLAVPLLAAVLAIFIALPCALAWRARPGLARILALSGAWVLGDLARQFVLTGFPWNPLGSVLAVPGQAGDVLLQGAALAGMHGLTLIVVLAACLPALGRRGIAGSALIIAALALYGVQRLAPAAPLGWDAVLVQANVPEAEHLAHWQDRAWAEAIFQRNLDLTAAGVAPYARVGAPPVLVVWPETASPWWVAQDETARRMIADAAGPALAALVGSPRQAGPDDDRNAMVVVRQDASVGGTYDKAHLVPYGEYFPSYLPIRLGERGWTPGPGVRTLHVAGLPSFGPLICYEAIFPGQVVDAADRPAMLVNITNDAWFGDSSGPRQHLVQARLRAIEEGLPVLRAANTGISALIDPYGRITARLELGLRGSVSGPVAAPLAPPPAAALGLWAPLCLALGCLLFSFLYPLLLRRSGFVSIFEKTPGKEMKID